MPVLESSEFTNQGTVDILAPGNPTLWPVRAMDILTDRGERGWFGRRDDSSPLSISKSICSIVVQ